MSIQSERARELRERAKQAETQAKVLRQGAAEIERSIEEASRPKMPSIGVGSSRTVLFEKYQSGRNYAYAALGWRVGTMNDASVRWVVTGSDGQVRHNWKSLLNFIGKANWSTLRVVTGTSPLVAPGDEPAVAETMGPYGRILREEHCADVDDYVPAFGDGREGDYL